MRRFSIAFLFLIALLQALWVQAQEVYEPSRAVRSLGMGGMYIPIVNDTDAVFYNPAALGRLDGINFKLIGVGLGVNADAVSNVQDVMDIDPDDASTYNNLFGDRFELEGYGKVGFAMPYFGFGYLTEYDLALELNNPAFPQFNTYFKNDTTIAIGGAFTIGPGTYVGMTLKRINRWGGINQDLGLSAIADSGSFQEIGNNFENKGQAYGIDLAVMSELKVPFNPSFALVLQDVGNTAFTKTSGNEAPPHIKQNLSLGVGGGVDLPGLDLAFGAEARHLLDSSIQAGKKIHLGAEVSLPLIDLRAGFNQGYLTYGLGLNLLIFHLDAVSYTEELGVYPGQTANNRYMLSLSIDLSFDANFKFTDNSGKRRKLKQRR